MPGGQAAAILPALLALLAAASLPTGQGELAHGRYRGTDTWRRLAGFAFPAGPGALHVELLFPTARAPQLALYHSDINAVERDAFNQLEEGPLTLGSTCTERLKAADELLDVDSLGGASREHFIVDGEAYTRLAFTVDVNHDRAQYLMVAFGTCRLDCESRYCASGADLEYHLRFTTGEAWDQHLDYERRAKWRASVAFFALYVTFVIVLLKPVALRLFAKRRLHVTVRLLLTSVQLVQFSLLCAIANGVAVALTGTGYLILDFLAEVLAMLADWTIVVFAMLLAKGWTITCRKISAQGRVSISILAMSYLTTSTAGIIYWYYFAHRLAVQYMYDSWSGLLHASLRLVIFIWFVRSINENLRRHERKRGFYRKVKILLGAWIMSLPALVLSNRMTGQTIRETVLLVTSGVARFAVHVVLTLLYDPDGWFKNSFPFHATVTLMRFTRVDASKGGPRAMLARSSAMNRRIQWSSSSFGRLAGDMIGFLTQLELNLDANSVDYDELEPVASFQPRHQNWIGA